MFSGKQRKLLAVLSHILNLKFVLKQLARMTKTKCGRYLDRLEFADDASHRCGKPPQQIFIASRENGDHVQNLRLKVVFLFHLFI